MGLSIIKALPRANSFFRSSNAQRATDGTTQKQFWMSVLLNPRSSQPVIQRALYNLGYRLSLKPTNGLRPLGERPASNPPGEVTLPDTQLKRWLKIIKGRA